MFSVLNLIVMLLYSSENGILDALEAADKAADFTVYFGPGPEYPAGMSKSTTWVLLALLIFVTAVIGAGDLIVLGGAFRQFHAGGFVRIPGRITKSEQQHMTILSGGISVEYAYKVAGREHIGSRYRYDDEYCSIGAPDAILSFPKGSVQIVYYNPKNPDDALLAPGIDAADLMLILFATPVSVGTILLWSWTLARLRERKRIPVAGGVRVRRGAGGFLVRLPENTVPEAALYALGCSSFAATFPVVALHGFTPALLQMQIVWWVVLSASVFAAGWTAIRNATGRYDLIYDSARKTITLPQVGGRNGPITFPCAQLVGVSLLRRENLTTSGSYHSFLPILDRLDPKLGQMHEVLSQWGWTEARAEAFGKWLGAELGREYKGVAEPVEEPDAIPAQQILHTAL